MRFRGAQRYGVFLLAGLVAVCAGAVGPASAHNGETFASSQLTTAPPVIDGVLTDAEWAAASTIPFGDASGSEVRVTNDGSFLYVAFSTTLVSEVEPTSSFRVYIDNGHDAASTIGDDTFWANSDDSEIDAFQTGDGFFADSSFEGTTDVESSAGWDGETSTQVFELKRPLCPLDSAHDACFDTEGTYGISFIFFHFDREVVSGRPTANPTAQADFADFTVAAVTDSESPTVDVTSPAPGAAVGGIVPFTADVSDPGGVDRVQFSLGDTLLATDTAAPYETSFDVSDLADGTNLTLRVAAYDVFENVTMVLQTAVVDNTPPDTALGEFTIDGSAATFPFFALDEGGASFECSLDGGPYETCASPKQYSDLPAGEHTFAVRAVDAAGNEDATPATHTWTVAGAGPLAFVVNVNTDEAPGACDFAHCTLREAIIAANTAEGANAIHFAITATPTIAISPALPALPALTGPTTIDGTTQTGAIVVVDGAGAGFASGFVLEDAASGSTLRGLRVQRFGDAGILVRGDGNTIGGNQIGSDGAVDLGNGQDGIRLEGARTNTISGNLISGNRRGLTLLSGSDANTITANTIGTNSSGAAPVPNEVSGIIVNQSSGNTIGGDVAADRNLISGNLGAGVAIQGSLADANVVRGNFVGVDAAGTGELGNGQGGIGVVTATNTLIRDNVSSGNGGAGVSVVSGGSGTVIEDNEIGTDALGVAPIGNAVFGVTIQTGASNNAVRSNTIAHNGLAGVSVQPASTGNEIVGNAIHDNAGLGIDLYPLGVTANDEGDGDTGANNLQNFPVIQSAVVDSSGLVVAGALDSPSGRSYRIDLFANLTCDESRNGEGAFFLASDTTAVESTSFSVTVEGLSETPVDALTVTATDVTTDNTSEFSECFSAESPEAPAPVDNLDLTVDRRSIPAGLSSFALSAIPASRIPFFAGAPSSSLVSLPAADVPAADVPAADVALSSSGIGKLTVGSVGLETIGQSRLDQVLLSSIQAPLDGVVAGTSLANRPFQTLTLADVYADPEAAEQFRALTLGRTGLAQTLLRGTRVISLLFGTLTLDQLGIGGGSTTLLAHDLSGGDIGATGVGSVPAADVPAADVPAADVPAADVDLVSTRLGDILIRALAQPTDVVDCGRIDCTATSTKTLRDAASLSPSAIRAGATLGDLFSAMGDITLNEVVMATLVRSEYPWGALPIEGLQDAVGTGDVANYRADFDLGCAAGSPTVEIGLPPGFLVRRASSRVARGLAAPAEADDPTRAGDGDDVGSDGDGAFAWSGLPAPSCAAGATTQHYSLTFVALAGLELGDFTSTIRVRAGGGVASSRREAPIAVTENWEANDTAAAAVSLPADTIAVVHVSSGIDREYFKIANPPRGWRTKIYLEHVPAGADFDVVATTAGAESLLAAPAADVSLDSVPLTDPGTSLSNNPSDTLGAETLQDIPFPSSTPAADVPAADVPAADVPAADVPAADVSAKRGSEDEAIQLFSVGEPGSITIGVSGYNASFSTDPATLRIRLIPPPPLPPCAPRTFPFDADPYGGADEAATGGTLPTSLPEDTESLLLVARDRLHDLYGATATNAFLALLDPGNADGIAAHGRVKGQPLYVDADPAVRAAFRAWDANPCSPDLANDVVRAINAVVARYRPSLTNLRYVVAHGSDEAMPYARVPDLVTLSNQADYAKSLAFTTNGLTEGNALYASAALGYVLTDNALGTFVRTPWLNRELYLPQVSVSRMVEKPGEMVRQYQQFLDTGGLLDPAKAKGLTASIDFLVEGGDEIAAGIGARASGPNAELRPPANFWSATDLLTGRVGKTIWSLNAHHDHFRLQPQVFNVADDIVTSTQLLPVVPDSSVPEFAGLVSFTMGCNAGANVDDRLSTDVIRRRDLAQSYAQQEAAFYLANLGFGYGETLPGGNGLSEKWMSLFGQALAGDATVGEMKLQTDHAYFQQMGTYGVFDEKVLAEVAAYGPPWYRFEEAAALTAGAASTSEAPPTTLDPATGLQVGSVTFDVESSLERHGDLQRGSFWTANGDAHFAHYRMPQPVVTRDVSKPGFRARGAGLRALVTHDVENVDPFLSTPTVFSSANEPEPTHFSDAIYPANFSSINTSFVFDRAFDSLVLLAGQFRPTTPPSAVGVERLVFSATYDVYYADPANPDDSSPLFLQAGSNLNDNGTATLWARAVDRGTGIKRLAALWTRGGADPWHYDELTPVAGTSSTFAATIETTVPIHALYWAVDGGGNTGYMNGKGFLTTTRPPDSTAPAIRITQPAPGGVYTLGASVPANYACTDPSGVQTCVGPVANRVAFDTSSVGEHEFTVDASDLSGNGSQRTARYRIGFGFSGFLAPIDEAPALNAANAGRTVPVRWKLTRADGTVIRDLAAVASITSRQIDCENRPDEPVPDVESSTATSDLRITGDEFHYNFRTDKAWAGTCRRLTVRLSDGTAPFVDFRFR